MKKRGFTLIELLAVIVVIGVIALIATPMILNTIEASRKGAFESTITGVIKASETYQARQKLSNPITECRYFSFGNDVETVTKRDDKLYYPIKDLDLKGTLPTEGEVKVCRDEIIVEVSDGNYSGRYDGEDTNISDGDLSSNDLTTPVIDNINTKVSTDSIIVIVNAHSPSVGGVIEKYYYKIDDGEYKESSEASYIFEELEPGKEYTIWVKVANKSGIEKEESKKVTTSGFGDLSISVEDLGTWTSSKKVTITGEGNKIEYQIVRYSEETIASTSEVYEYTGPFTINETVTENNKMVIKTRFNDGANTSDEKTIVITKIDTTGPSDTLPSVMSNPEKPTSETIITIRQIDSESGLDESSIEYGYSTSTDGTYTWQKNPTVTGLKTEETYYFKTKVTNNAGIETVSSASSEYSVEKFETCNVEITPEGWTTSKIATITGSQTGAKLQYKVNSGEWTDIESGATIELKEIATATNPTTVYCHFTDGTNVTKASQASTAKIDTTSPSNTEPTVEASSTKPTAEAVVTVKQTDEESGLDSTKTEYGVSTNVDGDYEWQTSSTFNELETGKVYYFKTRVTNGAGEETISNASSGYSPAEFATCSVEITPSEWSTSKVATIKGVQVGAQLQYKINSGSWTNISDNGEVTLTSEATEEDPTYVYCRFNDGTNTTDGKTSDYTTTLDPSKPNLSVSVESKTTTSLVLSYEAKDEESEISSTTCEYGTSDKYGSKGTINDGKCTITGLTAGTKYYYKVITTNGSKLTEEVTGSTSAGAASISSSVSQTPSGATYAQSKTYTLTYTAENITNPVYYVKTSVGTESTIAGVSCGTGNEPSTCSGESTKTLGANTWYKVSTGPKVTFTSNGTLVAKLWDGTSFAADKTITVQNIDTTAPSLNVGTISTTTNSITIPFEASDAESGISSTTCVYGTSTSYGEAGTVTDTGCEITGVNTNTKYYYQIVTTNGSGMTATKTSNTVTSSYTVPSITFTETPEEAVNGFYTSQVAHVTFNTANVKNPTYYIKTTRVGTSSAAVIGTCGTGTNPGDCTSASTTSLAANTWYKVSGNINVTYNTYSTSETDKLYAMIYDGTNYDGANVATLSKITTTVNYKVNHYQMNTDMTNYTLYQAETLSGYAHYSATPGVKTYTGFTSPSTQTITVEKDGSTTVNYYYTRKQVTVTFYRNISSSDTTTATQTFTYGVSGQTFSNKGWTNSGYQLVGWTRTQGGAYNYGTLSAVSDDWINSNSPSIKLYAVWVKTPTMSYTNTPETAVNGYYKEQVISVGFDSTNLTTPNYYIKSTRNGTSSISVTASCGTGDYPSTCSTITSTTSIVANTWYKVSGNLNMTYTEHSTSTGNLYAYVYDGTSGRVSKTGTISMIDATGPTTTAPTIVQSANNAFTVTTKQTDTESGIDSSKTKYIINRGSGYIDQAQTSSTFTGMVAGTTYCFYTTTTNNLGVQTTSESTCGQISYTGIAAGNYNAGDSITYAGVDWYVISDNGNNVTMITKENIGSGVFSGGISGVAYTTDYSSSYAKSQVDAWFESNDMLVSDANASAILSDSSTGLKVRLPRSAELSESIPNASASAFWTMTSSLSSADGIVVGLGNGNSKLGLVSGVSLAPISYYSMIGTSAIDAPMYTEDTITTYGVNVSTSSLMSMVSSNTPMYSKASGKYYSKILITLVDSAIITVTACDQTVGVTEITTTGVSNYRYAAGDSTCRNDYEDYVQIYQSLKDHTTSGDIGYRPVITVLEK